MKDDMKPLIKKLVESTYGEVYRVVGPLTGAGCTD